MSVESTAGEAPAVKNKVRRQAELVWERIEKIAAGIGIIITLCTVLGAVASYILEAPLRQRQATLAAWGVVMQSEGRHASAGRSEALRQLQAANESLAGLVLDNAILNRINLSGAELAFGSLRNVECGNCSFANANLAKADMRQGHYPRSCDFHAARMEDVRVDSASFADCDFSRSILHGARGDSSTTFNGTSLADATISNSDFRGSVFDNADLTRARIDHTNLRGARFVRAVVTDSHWQAVDGTDAELDYLSGDRVSFSQGTVLASATFDRSTLYNALFEHVDLHGAHFFGAVLRDSVFTYCDVTDADFTSADLTGVRFERCRIDRALFRDVVGERPVFSNCTGLAAERSVRR